jgi:hypothetical protein
MSVFYGKIMEEKEEKNNARKRKQKYKHKCQVTFDNSIR